MCPKLAGIRKPRKITEKYGARFALKRQGSNPVATKQDGIRKRHDEKAVHL